MRKPTRKTLTRKLDQICSKIVRARGQCAKCGEKRYEKLETSHIFSRKYRSLRWNLLNLVCLCKSCHFWAHANPILWGEFVRGYLGEVNYETLKLCKNPITQYKLSELQTLYDKLEEAA